MRLFSFIKNIISVMWHRHHFIIPPKYWKKYFNSFKRRLSMKREYYNPFVINEYNLWLKNREKCIPRRLEYNPLISFVIPVYNIEPVFLKDCLDSILNQSYSNFEICIADDHSTNQDTLDTLKEYEKKDSRIRVVYRKENGHISKATNSALEIVKGEYVALMDDDDKLDKNALYRVVSEINNDKTVDFIYSDEDKEDMDGNLCEPHFKPDFSKYSFFGGNYICHFTVIKKSLLDSIGYFREEYVGAQDFDLFLRATEKAKKIVHIPEILYHWRKVPGSTADTIENKEYAILNGKMAVEDALKRRGLDGYVTTPIKVTHYVVHFNLKSKPLLSIIMVDCNDRIVKNNEKELKKLNYKNFETIVTDYDKINTSIRNSKGDFVLIVSGKIKIDNPNIIEELIGYASQKDIGAVGPKIYHFGKMIKSAGLILNNKNIYINAFSSYFTDSYGLYGRLLVPYNYSAICDVFMLFEKKKYEEVRGFRDDVDFKLSSIDFNLKLLKNKYQNVLLSHLYIFQKDYKRKERFELSETEKNLIRDNWDLNNDIYYNKNLNDTYSFMLEVNSDEKK